MKNKKEYPSHPHKKENMYVDYDDNIGLWCIFGEDSGHAYGSYASEDQANEKLELRFKGNK